DAIKFIAMHFDSRDIRSGVSDVAKSAATSRTTVGGGKRQLRTGVAGEDDLRVRIAVDPAIAGNLLLDLTRAPARIAESEEKFFRPRAARNRAQNVDCGRQGNFRRDRQGCGTVGAL